MVLFMVLPSLLHLGYIATSHPIPFHSFLFPLFFPHRFSAWLQQQELVQQAETEVDLVEREQPQDRSIHRHDDGSGTSLNFVPSLDCILRVPYVDKVSGWQIPLLSSPHSLSLLLQYGTMHRLMVQRVSDEHKTSDNQTHRTEKYVVHAPNPRGAQGVFRQRD